MQTDLEKVKINRFWANPMLKIPELADMAGKSHSWIRDQLRSDDPPPFTKPGKNAQPLILWSDYVEWFKRKFGKESNDD